jgi:hypothetical protein
MAGNKDDESTILIRTLEKNKILAMNYWDIKDVTLLCVVTSHTRKIKNTFYMERRLNIYEKNEDNISSIYEFAPGDSFLSMYPISEDGNLMTIWVSGSAYRIYIFSLEDKKIKTVLEEGSKLMPEILDIDNDGSDEILITEGNFLINKDSKEIISLPEKTRIYKWVEKSYKLIETVSWKERVGSFRQRIKP